MAATMARIRRTRIVLDGSWNQRIPTITVPTAPIPPHTAYAVPIGIERDASSKSPMLIATETRKVRVQGMFRKPSTKRREVVKTTSKNPPRMSQNQAMFRLRN